MPRYDMKCQVCGEIEELLFSMSVEKKDTEWPCHCGEKMTRIPSSPLLDPFLTKPITLEHLGDKPETFHSQKDLRKRCKELGVSSGALL